MIAPMFGLYDLEFLLEKSLSVKVLINKDNFEIMGEFLVRWKFDFWVVKWLICLILVGFDDMGYDKWFDELDFGFCLILLGILKIGEMLDFLVGVWINQLYPELKNRTLVLVFATPHTPYNYGISTFFRGKIILNIFFSIISNVLYFYR